MTDLLSEEAMSLAAARWLLPSGRRGRPVSLSCMTRWVLQGVRTPHGIVRLEAQRLGHKWFTSAQAIRRFIAAQTPNLDGDDKATATTPQPEAVGS